MMAQSGPVGFLSDLPSEHPSPSQHRQSSTKARRIPKSALTSPTNILHFSHLRIDFLNRSGKITPLVTMRIVGLVDKSG